jgi:hypothetical protein
MIERERGSNGSLRPETVERLITEGLATREKEAASIERTLHDGGITEFIVSPRRKSAARVAVALENDGTRAYLTVGQAGRLEVDGFAGGDDHLRDILEAVFSGRFEETVRTRNSEVLSASGRLRLHNRTLKLFYGRLWSTFPFEFLLPGKRITYRYEAYA